MKKQLFIMIAVGFLIMATTGIAGAQSIPSLTKTYDLNWYVAFSALSGTHCYNRSVVTTGVSGPHTFTRGDIGTHVWDLQQVSETGCSKMSFQATCYYYDCRPIANGQQCGWWTETITGEHTPCESGLLYMGNNGRLAVDFVKRTP